MKYLFEHGADAEKDSNGWALLSASSSNGHLEMVSYLVQILVDKGTDVNN